MGFLIKKKGGTGEKHTREFTIVNRLGMHARPSAMFVKICGQFKCDVWVSKDGERVNGKSIMGLMMLAAGQGSVLAVTCEGDDGPAALTAIGTLVDQKFNED